jgi:hypothetical protein
MEDVRRRIEKKKKKKRKSMWTLLLHCNRWTIWLD